MTDYIEIYNTYLPSPLPTKARKNVVTDCPFCEGENKFSVEVSTGKARCLSGACDANCNHISFLGKYVYAWEEHTTDETLDELRFARGITRRTLRNAHIAWDAYKARWLLPYKNPFSPQLTNLGYFTGVGDNGYRIYKAPNEDGLFNIQFYNPYEDLKSPNCPIAVICEGEWDTLAMLDLLIKSFRKDPTNRPTVLGTPGSSTIPYKAEKYLEKFNHCIICYDHDENGAGHKGARKMAEFLVSIGKTVSILDWSNMDVEFGTDIRGIVTKYKRRFSTFHSLEEHLVPYSSEPLPNIRITDSDQSDQELSPGYISTIEGVPLVDSISDYFRVYSSRMQLSNINKAAIIAGLAVATTVYMPEEPLWGYFVGAASTGKTTFLESFGGENELFDCVSKLTPKALLSGMASADRSFFVTANNKMLTIKDFSAILNAASQEQKDLFDILREGYDGTIKQRWGNNRELNFHNLKFNTLAGVTPAIYRHNDADMGERFFRIDYAGREQDVHAVLEKVMKGFGRGKNNKKDELTQATVGYVKTILSNPWDLQNDYKEICPDDQNLIGALAWYGSRIRTKVDFDRNDGLKYRPFDEAPPRLAIQLTKMAYGVSKVIEPHRKFDDVFELHPLTRIIISKVAHDTVYSFTQEIMDCVHANPWSSREQIAAYLRLDQSRVQRTIRDMTILNLLSTKMVSGIGKGRTAERYAPHSSLGYIMENIDVHENSNNELSNQFKELGI